MHVGEEGAVLLPAKPQGGVLGRRQRVRPHRGLGRGRPEGVEPLRESVVAIDEHVGGEAAGRVSLRAEELRHRDGVLRQTLREIGPVRHFVAPAGGEERGDGGQRPGRLRARLREAHARGGERVDRRRLSRPGAEDADGVEPHRVAEHDEDVAGRLRQRGGSRRQPPPRGPRGRAAPSRATTPRKFGRFGSRAPCARRRINDRRRRPGRAAAASYISLDIEGRPDGTLVPTPMAPEGD